MPNEPATRCQVLNNVRRRGHGAVAVGGRQVSHRLEVRQLSVHGAGPGGKHPGPFGKSEQRELADHGQGVDQPRRRPGWGSVALVTARWAARSIEGASLSRATAMLLRWG